MEESVFSDFQIALRALRRRWWVAVLVGLLAFGAGATFILRMPLVYESRALLRYRPAYRGSKVPAGFFPQELADVTALREEVLNRPSLEELLTILPPAKARKPLSEWRKLLGMTPEPRTEGLKRSIEIYPVRSNIENNLVRITCRRLDPQEAANIARSLSDQFIAKHQEQVRRYVSEGRKRLFSRISAMQKEREAADEALAALYRELAISPARLEVLDRRTKTLNTRLEQTIQAEQQGTVTLEGSLAELERVKAAAEAAIERRRREPKAPQEPELDPRKDPDFVRRYAIWQRAAAALRAQLARELPLARRVDRAEAELREEEKNLAKLRKTYSEEYRAVQIKKALVARLDEDSALLRAELEAAIEARVAEELAEPQPKKPSAASPRAPVGPVDPEAPWLSELVGQDLRKQGTELARKKDNLTATLELLRARRAKLETDVKSLEEERERLLEKLARARPAQARLKKAEQEARDLQAEYDFLAEILPEANSQNLTSRFEVVEPAIAALYPMKSNRLRNLLVMAVLAVGAAMGSAIVLDQLSAKGREDKAEVKARRRVAELEAASQGQRARVEELESLLQAERDRFARELAEARASAAEARAAAAALQLSAEPSPPSAAGPEAAAIEDIMPGLRDFAAEYGLTRGNEVRLLGLLVKSPDRALGARELSAATGASEAQVSASLDALVEARAARRVKSPGAEGGVAYTLSSSPKTRSRLAALQREDRNGRA